MRCIRVLVSGLLAIVMAQPTSAWASEQPTWIATQAMATNAGVPHAFPIGCRNYLFPYELLSGSPQVLRVHLQLLSADRSTLGSAYDYDVPTGTRTVPMQLCEKSMRAKPGPYSMLVEVTYGAHSAIEFSQALAFSTPPPVKTRIVCFKFKKVRVVVAVHPKCPVGFKLQRSPQN